MRGCQVSLFVSCCPCGTQSKGWSALASVWGRGQRPPRESSRRQQPPGVQSEGRAGGQATKASVGRTARGRAGLRGLRARGPSRMDSGGRVQDCGVGSSEPRGGPISVGTDSGRLPPRTPGRAPLLDAHPQLWGCDQGPVPMPRGTAPAPPALPHLTVPPGPLLLPQLSPERRSCPRVPT